MILLNPREVFEAIDVGTLAGGNQALNDITDVGSLLALVEQGVFSVGDDQFDSAFTLGI